MFAAIAGVGALANRLGQSVIPFYIVAGMVLSEFVFGRVALPVVGTTYIAESEFIAIGAELGIVFLLFFSDWSSTSTDCSPAGPRSVPPERSISPTSGSGSSSAGSSSARSCRRS